MTCEHCHIEMDKKGEMETGNCEGGCCPIYFKIYQCPRCKTVETR